MRILGIDPGLRFTGYGVVDLPVASPTPKLVEAGVIKLNPKQTLAQRLVVLDAQLTELLGRFAPARVAVEKLYSHYAHPRTAILMGHARGVILCAAGRVDAELVDWPSTEVKKALTGHGHASKAQVQHAVAAQIGLAEPPSPPDVADAIAIAWCDAQRLRFDPVVDAPTASVGPSSPRTSAG
ncbi:MAG: crossover junction endodeoxyribonuclease RuvC [Planctomycetota bacterium]